MVSSNIFHYGILVPHIETAISFYEATLGVTFLPPVEAHYPRVQQKDWNEPFSGRVTYSRTGPMHIELLETNGPGIWAPQPGDHIHHIGMWADDPQRMADEMVSKGFEWEAYCHLADGSVPIAFVRRGSVRLEMVDARRRERWADWVAGKITSPR